MLTCKTHQVIKSLLYYLHHTVNLFVLHTCSQQLQAESDVMNRLQLDRRRLEAAHLRYAVLNISSQFNLFTGDHAHITLESDIYQTLKEFTPAFFKAFTSKYAGSVCAEVLYTWYMLGFLFQPMNASSQVATQY